MPTRSAHAFPNKGEVTDLHRRGLARNYPGEFHCAVGDGVPMRSCFLWSFLDNFQWQDAHMRGFGSVHTAYVTLPRISKLGARWYVEFMRRNRLA